MQKNILVGYIAALKIDETIIATASSDSMYPAIKPGQEIKITKIPSHKIKVGDIIAFTKQKKRRIIVHRVVQISSENGRIFYITKGDNLDTCDKKMDATNIMGIVEPQNGLIAKIIHALTQYT